MSKKNASSFPTLLYFLKTYPLQNLLVVFSLLLAGFSEVLGIGALLPLVGVVLGQTEKSAEAGTLENLVYGTFDHFGVDPTLEILLAFVVGTIFSKAIIIFFAMRYVSVIAAEISRHMRVRLINSLMHAQWPYYSSVVTGHISNAVSEQAQRAGHCYMLAGHSVATALQVLIYIVLAFLVSVNITLLAIVAGLILGYSVKRFINSARQAGQQMTESMNSMLARLNEALQGVKPIKAMAEEVRFMNFLKHDADLVLDAQRKQYSAGLLLTGFYEPGIVLFLGLGLYYVLTYTVTPVTNVFLLAFLFHRLLSHVSLLQSRYQNMAQAESALWFLIQQSEKAENNQEVLPEGKGFKLNKSIKFKNIDISYDGETFLFQNLNEEILANKVTLLFGVSGIGKTTLTDTILAMHKPYAGELLIDDTPLSEIDIKDLRSHTGYVPQDTFLFHDTIAHNVTLGNSQYSDKDVENALKASAAWEFVNEMDEGIYATVGERGGRLSGGQRQRIALARCLIRKPKLLILDEATSGLDENTEKLVLDSVLELKNESTVIIISHNPKFKEYADKVISL